MGGAFVALAALFYWRDRGILCLVASGLGTPLLIAGLFVPDRLGAVYRAWMRMGLAISRVTTPIFMGLLFFVVLTPGGLLIRLLGRNPLVRSRTGSVWVARDPGSRRGDIERQF